MRHLLTLVLLLTGLQSMAQTKVVGIVQDQEHKPLPFANVLLPELQAGVSADENGKFSYTFAAPAPASVTLSVSYVGKHKLERTVPLQPGKVHEVALTLQDNNLYLNEVEINAKQVHTTNSNSSIVIEQAAIEQIQPYSLSDILLNLLPGQTILNPDLQSAKTINLRTVATDSYAQNSQFGTAIILDGEALSNNTNLQASGNGFGLSNEFTAGNYGTSDFTFSSVDLRQIPANNIEKIEVIQGVPSARYGDLTDGAILIDRKAGVSPWSITARIQDGTNNFGLNKGFKLGPKLGSLNTSLDYLDSSPSTTNKQKSYKRLSTGLLWSTYLDKSRKVSSHLSVDYATSFDTYNVDSEKDNEVVKSDNSQWRLNYRGFWKLSLPVLDNLSYSAAYSLSNQYSYESVYRNAGVQPMSISTVAGVAQGIFTYPNYQAETEVYGKPQRLSFSLNGHKKVMTGAVQHQLSFGGNYSHESNRGQGYEVDPFSPRWKTGSSRGQSRDYAFEQVPALANMGFYLEDMFTTQVSGKKLITSAGIRLDEQFQKWSVSPRISSSLELSERTTLKAAFGLATKSPGLIHLQPKPVYFDYQLLNYYPNKYKENLVLYYTEVVTPDNSQLKAMRSQTMELGITHQKPLYDISLTAFRKQVRRGFSQASNLYLVNVPEYTITETRPDQQPLYAPTGNYSRDFGIYKSYSNDLHTDNYGLELYISTIKFAAIQTSFNLSSTLYYSRFYRNTPVMYAPEKEHFDKEAVVGIFLNPLTEGLEAISTLSTNHHISKLGLLVNFRAQFFWDEWKKNSPASVYPIAYINQQGSYVAIPEGERDSQTFAHLVEDEKRRTSTFQQFVYSNYHLKLSKEIHNLVRLSFYANNFLNHRPEVYDDGDNNYEQLNQSPAFGMELRLTIK